jgi:hypothetical protein
MEQFAQGQPSEKFVQAALVRNVAYEAGQFVSLMGLRGRAKTIDPFSLGGHGPNFLRAFAQASKIYVKRTVAKECVKCVDPVAEPLEHVVKLRVAYNLPIGTQERRRQKPDRDALYRRITVCARKVSKARRDPFVGGAAPTRPEKLVFGTVNQRGYRVTGNRGRATGFKILNLRFKIAKLRSGRRLPQFLNPFQGAFSPIQTEPFSGELPE